MMNFLLRISAQGNIEFRNGDDEKIIYNVGGIRVHFYGVVDKPKELCKMATKDADSFFNLRHRIIGAYTLITIDSNTNRCRLLRSTMGGNKTVYYVNLADSIYIFSSIKYLRQLGYTCKFNDDKDVLYDFIYNGFIRTKHTLIHGVYKLLADEYIEIDSGKMTIKKVPRITADETAGKVSTRQMYEVEKHLMDSYIDLALDLHSDINIAISGGYDSNLILHFLRERKLSVNAFSIGGERGLDETINAQKLCEHSGNALFHKGKVGKSVLSHMREIAAILEGDVYERGVFMQYALGSLLQEHGVHFILLGEGADQVFNENFYIAKDPEFLTNYLDNPYELGIMLVMKKSYMMLAHFGIMGLYPFIHEDMQRLGSKLYKDNGTSKMRQKEMCKQAFDDFMNELITKNPGSTSLCALFENREDEEKFIKNVQVNNEFYNPSFRISYKYGPRESELDYYLCLEYLKAFKEVFCN